MYLITKIEKILNRIVFVVGLAVMLAWIFEIKVLTNLVSGGATMKFNTALLFVLASSSIYFSRKKNCFNQLGFYSSIALLLSISGYSFAEYFIPALPDLDNLFVSDHLSPIQIGRMSLATATCFTLFGLGSLFSLRKPLEKAAHYIFIAVLYLAVVSAIAYLLAIPLSSRPFYFKTMAIHTSALFVLLAYISLVRLASSRFVIFLYSKHSGSRMLRTSLPLVIILPILFNFVLIHVIRESPDSTAFTIVAGTVIFISVGIIYLSITAKTLNDADRRRKRLDNLLQLREKHQYERNMMEETHHRVKNNFQLVSSMLQLQAHQIENQNLTGILMNCKDRVGTMAVLHENIYKYGAFKTVELNQFLTEIIDSIKTSYLDSDHIKFSLNIIPQYLNAKQAIPVGLIINEILTNSIKHAFSENNKGEVKIEIDYTKDQNVKMKIEDNGIGFDATEVDKDSMGTSLIEIFTQQLEGTITLKSTAGKGTTYLLEFPLMQIEQDSYFSKSA